MTYFQFRGIQTHTHKINTSGYKMQWAQDRMIQFRQMCIVIIGLILHYKLGSLRAESSLESTTPPGNIRMICLLATRENTFQSISFHGTAFEDTFTKCWAYTDLRPNCKDCGLRHMLAILSRKASWHQTNMTGDLAKSEKYVSHSTDF